MCKLSPLVKQFLTIITCNLLAFTFGMTSGWATINFVELQSENSTFPTGPLNLEEASLVVSLINFGGFFGNFAALPIIHKFGIKRTIHMCGVPFVLSTILIIWAQNVYYLYISRVLCGLSTGVLAICMPSLVNDISYDSVRGTLNSLFDPMNNTGIIVSFFLGNYLTWLDQAKLQFIAPIITTIILFFLPESPEYFIKRNKEKKSIKSQKFYKGSIAALEHAEFLQKLKDEKVEIGKSENIDCEIESNSKLCLQDFLTPQAKKACFIAFFGLAINYCSGTLLLLSYSTEIFTKTGSSLSPKDSSLLISITQICANLMFANIVDRFNRRTLQFYSSILCIISFFAYATYCLLWMNQPEYQWVPTVCFTCIVYFSWMGQIPIPFIVMTEIFPKKIRQTCLALSNSLFWIIFFVLGSIYPVFLETFGPFICMITFGCVCVINLIFGYFFLPETRGKSYQEIMDLMSK